MFTLTENEKNAALALVRACLSEIGGSRPADLEFDEYTWVKADDLVNSGWSKPEAAGTFGALLEKGVVSRDNNNDYAITTKAWKWLDTIWI